MFEKGEIAGRYRVEKIIGKGGMSRVYKVKDMRVGTYLAMKEITPDESFGLNSGYREASVLKMLNHPLLPRITDIVRTDKSFCVVMDYIDGENLEEYVKKYGGFDEQKAVEIADKLLDCLIYLHSPENKIIYRDLKPSNIMITQEGNIKLIDFGISDSVTNKKESTAATREFAPPEQLLGKEADEKGDIYSLGATLKYLLKDRPSYGFDLFLKTCMKNNPKERYQSAEEAKKELKETVSFNEKEILRLKNTVHKNLIVAVLFILSLTGVCLSQKFRLRTEEEKLKELNKAYEESMDSSERREILKSIIKRDPTYEWYSKYFDELKADYVFEYEEALECEEMLRRDYDSLKGEDYEKTAGELGRMYMFYYEDFEDEYERLLKATYWFDEAGENKEEMDVYSRIGHFLFEIQSMILEGKDGGMYSKYYSDLNDILSEIPRDESLLEIHVISLYADSVLAYGADFYREGISVNEMRNHLLDMEERLKLRCGGREEEKEKDEVLKRIEEAKGELDYIENNFGEQY